MYCVYLLSHNNHVFYIGITQQPADRYRQHASCVDSCTAGYIYNLRLKGLLPEFEIIYIGNKTDALTKESELIKSCSIIKHKLCNSDLNPVENRIVTPFDWNNRIKYPRKTYTRSIYKYWNEIKNRYEQNRY